MGKGFLWEKFTLRRSAGGGRRAAQIGKIKRLGHHRQTPVRFTRPTLARPITIEFQAVAVGIVQIESLADAVVRGAVEANPGRLQTAQGVGEGGTVAATPTVMNAILGALAPLGVSDVPMPATSERIWRAIRAAQRG